MAADNKEQRVCVKFCFVLGKWAAETVLLLQDALSKLKFTSGVHGSKGVKCHVRTSPDLADLQPAKMMKILKISQRNQCRSSSDHWWDFWYNWFVLEFMSATRNVAQRWLDPSPQQCPCSHGLECAAVFGNKQYDSYPSSSPFTRPCAMRLFSVPLYERPDERETFCWCQRSEKENAGCLEQHQHGRVPEMFSALGKTLVEVYRVEWRVHQRRLDL